jgi:peptidoglycan/xylan/chitin deacetylase (PgdA/CDA1 family)
MLSSEELRELHACGFGIGTHGNRHEPLTAAQDVDAELIESKKRVANVLGVDALNINSLSFPFSKQNASVVARARSAGYKLLFGGGQSLTPIARSVPALIARVGITASEVSDSHGNLLPHLLAIQLFRQPHRSLVAGPIPEN